MIRDMAAESFSFFGPIFPVNRREVPDPAGETGPNALLFTVPSDICFFSLSMFRIRTVLLVPFWDCMLCAKRPLLSNDTRIPIQKPNREPIENVAMLFLLYSKKADDEKNDPS
jgi:hypothetical protein